MGVQIGERSATPTAGADGKWLSKIDPPASGGPYTMRSPMSVSCRYMLVRDQEFGGTNPLAQSRFNPVRQLKGF